jgi:hypothetical protein
VVVTPADVSDYHVCADALRVFDPLADSMKYTVTNLMNYIPTEKLEPYPDRVEDNYFTMYIMFNALVAAVIVFSGEKLVLLARNS